MTVCRKRFLLPFALPFLLALPLPAQIHSSPDVAAGNAPPQEVAAPPTVLVTLASSAPVEPTPAEMRSMSPERLEAIGDRLRTVKDYLGSLDCYRAAIRKTPTAMLYNKVAMSEIFSRRPGEAVKAAKKAVRIDRTMAEAWNNLGVSYYLSKQLGKAIKTYERAVSLSPGNASFHNNLAAALMDHKEFERGIEEYRKAFTLDPEFFEHSVVNGVSARLSSPEDRAQYSFVMAGLFASAGDFDRALHFLQSAMEDGYPKIDDVYKQKEFASLLSDARFQALMKDRPLAIR